MRAFAMMVMSTLVSGHLGAQYIPPGTGLASSIVTDETELRTSWEEAPLKAGAIRLSPWAGLRDAAFVDTATTTENETDLTLTLGAGLRAYLRSGSNILWAAHVLPEYAYWQDNEDKRRLGGRAGVGFFGYFNRLDVEVSARRDETQSFFSSELQELTTTRTDSLRAAFDLKLFERLGLLGSFERREFANQEDETPIFARLDRDEDLARVSLRYRSPQGWYAGLGLEDGEREFASSARNLSHDVEAGFFDFGYEGGRFSLFLSVNSEELTPVTGSELVEVDTTSGNLETQWDLSRRFDIALYGRRQVQFSVQEDFSSFLNDRFGVRLGLDARRSGVQLIAEIGEDDFEASASGGLDRVDDVYSFGMEYRFELRRFFDIHFSLIHTDYDSNIDQFDRQVTSWNATLELNALRERFRIGDGDRTW